MHEPSTFSALLARIASTLDAHGLPYMVIGGHAAILYGEPRLTRDIDITLGAGPDRLGELLETVRDADLVASHTPWTVHTSCGGSGNSKRRCPRPW